MFFNKYFALLCLLGLGFMSLAVQNKEIEKARELYRKASQDEKYALQLQELGAKFPNDALLLGYEGTATAILASYASLPWKKYRLLQDGLAKLNLAIVKMPKEIELRLLRLSVESQVPSFVPFDDHKAEDTQYIKNNYYAAHPMADVMRKFAKIK
jgi:hypothetical protein